MSKKSKRLVLYVDQDDDTVLEEAWEPNELKREAEEAAWDEGEYKYDVYEYVGTATMTIRYAVTIEENRK